MTANPKITDSSKRSIHSIILLRLVVGYLGEKPRKAWWGTDLLGATGVRFLENVFPRTAWNAALTSTCEAARIVHDQSIGRSGSYHLFRLPPDIESIVEGAQRMTDFKGLWTAIQSEAEAFQSLEKLAESQIQAPAGPVQIGVASRILRKDSVNEIAAHYASSFKTGNRCFPYFAKE
jgi:hypothetical protein